MARRTDRLYALVEELRARAPRPVSRLALADRLEVTPRTVERDILSLQQAGVPIWSHRGRDGGYAIDPQWSLPPLNFDATEALAVMAALATARSIPFAEAGRRAERKMLAAMTAVEADRAKELAARIRLGPFGPPTSQDIIRVVEEAIVDRRVIELEYRDRDGVASARPVEAHGLHLSADGAYLVAWCRLRQAGRAFRIDRIVSARPTDEVARDRRVDSLLDWLEDATALDALGAGGVMAPATRGGGRGGPPRKADHRTGSSAPFVRAVASALPGVTVTSRRDRSTFSVGGERFLVVDNADETMSVALGSPQERTVMIHRVGRDDARALVEDAWREHADTALVAEHTKRRKAWLRKPPITTDDVRAMVAELPGTTEGPIWGKDLGFLIGTEKRTRFARFGRPDGGGVSNLLPPDDENTFVLLRCPQKPALLADAPDRFFTTPHYGPVDEPGGVILRLAEHRGAEARQELAELLEDAWREVAPPELVDELERKRPTTVRRSTKKGVSERA